MSSTDPIRLTYLRHLQPAAAPTQRPGDLSSVRLTTPGGELRGEFALDVFELLRLRGFYEACAAEPEEVA